MSEAETAAAEEGDDEICFINKELHEMIRKAAQLSGVVIKKGPAAVGGGGAEAGPPTTLAAAPAPTHAPLVDFHQFGINVLGLIRWTSRV